VLEIPTSITADGIVLKFRYRISSPTIELVVSKLTAGTVEPTGVNARRYNSDGWNSFYLPLNSDVEAVRLVAKKRVVTTTAEYVLVISPQVQLAEGHKIPMGNTSLLHYIGVD